MFLRHVKRKCNIRGCKSTDCYAISRTREVGNTVIICKSCLSDALGAIGEMDPKSKSNIPAVDNTSYPSLFFNSKALGTAMQADIPDAPQVSYEDEWGETDPQQISDVEEAPAAEDIAAVEDAPIVGDAADTDGVVLPEDVIHFKCPACGKDFDSERGLKTHARYCKVQNDGE